MAVNKWRYKGRDGWITVGRIQMLEEILHDARTGADTQIAGQAEINGYVKERIEQERAKLNGQTFRQTQ